MLPFAIPMWAKAAAVAVVIAVIGIVIYQWREDIRSAAYDSIFKKQVEAAMQENRKDFARQMDAQKENIRSLTEQMENQKAILNGLENIRTQYNAQKFQNRAIDPGLKFVFDQIRAAEEARKAELAKKVTP